MALNKVYVVTAKSESGDDYGPWIFTKEISDKKLEAFLREECEQEFNEDDDGPGEFNSYLHLNREWVDIIE